MVEHVQLEHGSFHSVSSQTYFFTSCRHCSNADTEKKVAFTSVSDPVSVMVSLNVAVKVCETELTERLSALGLSGTSLSQLRWFLPHYSDTPPVSPNSMYDNKSAMFAHRCLIFSAEQFMSDCPPVTVTICEGYFGQNCCLSLLALLLPP